MLQSATLSVKGGQSLGIVGPNGAGKTVLLKALAGLHKPRSGTILLGATPVDGYTDPDRHRHFGYLPQDIQLLPGSIGDNISRFQAENADPQVLFHAAQIVGGTELVQALPEGFATQYQEGTLSAGQTQIVGLARALYGDPMLVLLDEPTANLDASGKATVIDVIKSRQASGKITVFVSHDQQVLSAADHLLYLAPNTAKYGATSEVLRFIAHMQQGNARTIAEKVDPK
ncbi:MAG: ATP-binding cassette domain-containing protein [Paracoccaceae bacterium]